jgi:hypothetical protein
MTIKQQFLHEVQTLLLTLFLIAGFSFTTKAMETVELSATPAGDRSSIRITYPDAGSIWAIPGPVEIRWDTQNIPSNKNLRFYLIKDDMVAQELGVYKNTGLAEGIKLQKALQAGSNYRVMAIELFPADKNYVAKYATPFFTLTKVPRQRVKDENILTEQNRVRNMFDGRKINYVQELIVSSEDISINLWDHGRQDGDVVSIYLNGEAVVSKYSLTYHKQHFDLRLDASKNNDLFLYAHNLGKFPPNTVSVEILDGTVADNIVLNSDLKSCEAVLIKVKD